MQLLKNKGVKPQIVEYLKTPLDADELKAVARKMGLEPREFIRTKEVVFKELGLKEKLNDAEVLFKAMAEHPKLMERPIAVKGERAVLGLPPEKMLELL